MVRCRESGFGWHRVKRRKTLALLSLVLPLFLGLGAQLPQSSGLHEGTLERPDARVLRFTVSVPDGYEPDQPRPLVLALHYGGRVTPFYGKDFLIRLVEPGLEKLGAVLVAPDCPYRGWANPKSETEVMVLLDHILQNYAIDRDRIVVTGFSMGGAGAWYMAAHHPEVFSAAIVVAGSPPAGTVEMLDKMPLYVIHSRDDEVVPIGPANEAVKTLESHGAPAKLLVVQGITHFQVPEYGRHLRRAAKWLEEQWDP